MPIDSFNPDDIWKPFGAFSMAVVQGTGRVVHLKGQVSLNDDGNVVGKGDIDVQVTQVLENIQTVLASFGGRMEDIYSLTHHVTNIDEFMKTGHIRNKYFKPPYPVTTTVEVSRLYNSSLMVEITGSAEIPLDRFKDPDEAK
jgi:enamine deaminase RidA (YjgF/YER057c/UK114 family)